MSDLRLPSLPPVVGGNVIVSNEAWTALVKYLRTVQTVVNSQSAQLAEITKELSQCRAHIATIAEALGGIYNVQD